MKSKIICLLTILFCCGLAASPNRNCDGLRCPGKQKAATTTPAEKVVMMIDDMELLPIHHYLSNF